MNQVTFYRGSGVPSNMTSDGVYFSDLGRIYYKDKLIGENLTKLVVGEGTASGINSIAGGTTDKDMISGLLGGLTSSVVQLHPSEAKGALSISLGADNVANTGGSVALGYENISGGKGYYVTAIDTTNRTITLSTKQTSTSSPGNPSWNAGDILFFVNDGRYWLEVSETTSSNIVKVVEMPFDSLVSVNILTSKPNERAIINVNKPESGVVDIGWGAIGIGAQNTVVGSSAYTVGYKNTIVGDFGAALGQENTVGYSAFATGIGNQAKGKASVALGDHVTASANCSSALGGYTKATAYGAFAVGDNSQATGLQSTALGYYSTASDKYAIAGGDHATASAYATVALGSYVNATADYAVALGGNNDAQGNYSFAQGNNTLAKGTSSHAEGEKTIAENAWTHSEGYGTVAGVEGVPKVMHLLVSDARASHAEGTGTHARGPASHAEGISTVASGKGSHAGGIGTIATAEAQTVVGKYNVENSTSLFIVGCGTDSNRKNAFEVNSNSSGVSLRIGSKTLHEATVSKLTPLDGIKVVNKTITVTGTALENTTNEDIDGIVVHVTNNSAVLSNCANFTVTTAVYADYGSLYSGVVCTADRNNLSSDLTVSYTIYYIPCSNSYT